MSLKIDFHIHTCCSDGTMSPEEIVEKYNKEEFSTIAITDHEVTDGIKAAQEAARDKNIKVIPGIELATDTDSTELHILGYYIDTENARLKEALARLAEIRKKRNEGILRVLQEKNIEIEEKDLIQHEGQTYIGKPNFAAALLDKGYIKEFSEAFSPGRFLESEEVRAVRREKLSTEEAIDLIRGAVGIPVLAHPCKIRGIGRRGSEEFEKNFDVLLAKLKKAGLKGLECVYPQHNDEERLYFISMASKYHLHVTEGSDFHGRQRTFQNMEAQGAVE